MKDQQSGADGALTGTVIGGSDISCVKDGAYACDSMFSGYERDGNDFYQHVYMAYPKNAFKANEPRTMTNTVTYTLTAKDTGKVTTATGRASVQYAPHPFTVPAGNFMLYKWGISQDGTGTSLSPYGMTNEYGSGVANHDHQGIYPYQLNKLQAGQNVDVTYDVVATNHLYQYTYAGEGDPSDQGNYGKKAVNVTVCDNAMYFDHDYTTALGPDDYEVKSLRVLDPQMYAYATNSDGSWAYQSDGTVPRPNVDLYGKASDGDWVHYGTAAWGADGLQSLRIAADNGATAGGSTLTFPKDAGITQWKMTYSSSAAAVYTGVLPTITIKPSTRIENAVARLSGQSDTAAAEIANAAHMQADQDGKVLGERDARGYDSLASTAQGVWMRKSTTVTGNDTARQLIGLHYDANVYEQSNITSAQLYAQAVADGAVAQDHGGTFYDLLPQGVTPDLTSVTAQGSDVTAVHAVDDWRGSGRTMLKVTVAHTPAAATIRDSGGLASEGYGDTIRLGFDARYRWSDATELGKQLTNNIAYQSTTGQLGTRKGLMGEPDDPTAGNNQYSADATQGVADLMSHLSGAASAPNTVYASSRVTLDADTSAFVGLRKQVASDVDGVYGDGLRTAVTVPAGGTYRYALDMRTDQTSRVEHVVLYDDLDGYTPTAGDADHGGARWEGSFIGVDTARLRALGIKPVVYYATAHVDLGRYSVSGTMSSLPDLSDGSVWTTTVPQNPADVKAIAIDCSTAVDGSPFVMAPNSGLTAIVRMRAPIGDAATQAIERQAHAYNNVYMSSTQIMDNGQRASHYIHHDYTKVGLTPFNVTAVKTFDDDGDRDGTRPSSVRVQLMRDGAAEGAPVTLDASNSWTHVWKNLARSDEQGNAIDWNVQELDVADGYTAHTGSTVTADGLTCTLTNVHEIETVPVHGVKRWQDKDAMTRPDAIEVVLLRDGTQIDSRTVHVDAEGAWTYDFGELPKNHRVNGAAVPYTYAVHERYVEGYVPQYAADGFDITNRYDPYGDITLTKTASGVTDESQNATFTFRLTLRKADGAYDTGAYAWTRTDGSAGSVENGGTVTLKAGQSVTVKRVPSTDTYAWTEEGTDGFAVGSATGLQGTVTTGGNAQGTVRNVYTTQGSVQIQAHKTLHGRALGNRQFRFELLDANGDLVRTANNDADGTIAFGTIGYGAPDDGRTYTYTMREVDTGAPGYTYDHRTYIVKVAVSDNGDGTMSAVPTYYDAAGTEIKDDTGANTPPTFSNAYTATGSMDLTATKVFVGGDLTKRHFTFEMLDAAGKPLQQAVTDDSGEARFKPIAYSEQDAGKSFTYTIKESVEDDDAVTWDTHMEQVTATVSDNGDGTLAIAQRFHGGDASAPLVWRNQAANGTLRIVKKITDDEATQAHADTVFPMEVTLAVPAGAKPLDGEHDVTVIDRDNQKSVAHVTIAHGRFRVGVPAGGSVTIGGVPGGTGYAVTEVASLTEEAARR
ncbi:Cna protein B-type domain-containing protein [Bifidobacterium pseudolongum subsp. globosum]|uniref:Cna protein B-type domain-containing protein n=1 Tax=Bifidobacterium pseudolongum subsp. globosum TaxID=1690 RepID=A0A4Q4ZZB0_9BIFI|nr:Cna B-type domain-containing protein [Bifidobacterium pseudolongum]RYQ09069.1 Cna protein B-type domain-containing protein [Bifidobacterium pseudolongum subsp. globosum]